MQNPLTKLDAVEQILAAAISSLQLPPFGEGKTKRSTCIPAVAFELFVAVNTSQKLLLKRAFPVASAFEKIRIEEGSRLCPSHGSPLDLTFPASRRCGSNPFN